MVVVLSVLVSLECANEVPLVPSGSSRTSIHNNYGGELIADFNLRFLIDMKVDIDHAESTI